MTGYTVIDFETTGFSPQKHDRVVEVGVVYVSADGEIQDSWGTLINPERDMGATHVHGITTADVLGAPTFRQIAPYILRAVAGRTVVAHNARFDVNFLEHELQRAGIAINPGTPTLCTMEWSSKFLKGASRKLADCCLAAGVHHEGAHSALTDAIATAQLLAYYVRAGGTPPPWSHVLRAAAAHSWPAYDGEPLYVAMVHRAARQQAADAWLDKITSTMPRVENPAVESYVDVLERALLDGYLSAHEKSDLVELAGGLGLHRDQLDKIHRVYLAALASAAWADGVVTVDEQMQLTQVAMALGVPMEIAKQILREAEESVVSFALPTLQLVAGDRVVFTGELSRPRDEWVARAAALGLVHGAVTKATRAVVAADPDSLSGKAAKARDYGIPIITEAAFESIVTAMEERRHARSEAISTP